MPDGVFEGPSDTITRADFEDGGHPEALERVWDQMLELPTGWLRRTSASSLDTSTPRPFVATLNVATGGGVWPAGFGLSVIDNDHPLERSADAVVVAHDPSTGNVTIRVDAIADSVAGSTPGPIAPAAGWELAATPRPRTDPLPTPLPRHLGGLAADTWPAGRANLEVRHFVPVDQVAAELGDLSAGSVAGERALLTTDAAVASWDGAAWSTEAAPSHGTYFDRSSQRYFVRHGAGDRGGYRPQPRGPVSRVIESPGTYDLVDATWPEIDGLRVTVFGPGGDVFLRLPDANLFPGASCIVGAVALSDSTVSLANGSIVIEDGTAIAFHVMPSPFGYQWLSQIVPGAVAT